MHPLSASKFRQHALGSAVRSTFEQLEERRLFSTAYALLGTGGTILARFDTSTPGTIDQTVAVTGLGAGTQLRGIDFRPATGELYGLGITPTSGDDMGTLFKIDPQTGTATQIGPGPFTTALAAGSQYGFDFNPAVDRIRVTNGEDQNLRINPNSGALVQFDTPLNNSALEEEVVGGAYDRNVNDVQPAGSPAPLTTLFGIDFINDTLVRVGGVDAGPPEGSANAGVVTTVGPLGFTTGSAANGFDIAQDGTAFAIFNNGSTGKTSLYTVNLATGAATAVDILGNGAEFVRGFAVAPDDAPPSASPDTYQVGAGGSLTVSAADGVLANDADPEGNALTAERITQPANGVLVFNADGSFQYTPNPGFVGTDSFTYVANDGTSDSQSKIVTLNVVSALTINDKAIAEGNSGTKQLTFTVTLSAPAPAGGVTVNFETIANTASASDLSSLPSGLLTFAAGETTKSINVSIKGDTKKESDETFFVRLYNSVGASIGDDRATGTIVNDDSPGKKSSIGSLLVASATVDATKQTLFQSLIEIA